MLVVALAANHHEPAPNRYHQHLQEEGFTPCADHGDGRFCTHLPLINIVTDDPVPESFITQADGTQIQNDTMVSATITYFDSDGNNHLIDEPTLSSRAMFRTRGASSRSFDKKGYLIKLMKDDLLSNRKHSFSGMAADNEWALHGPFIDKTLLRNYLCYNLSGEIMDYAPNVRFCEMFLNGEYMGVYLLMEKVTYSSNGRINISRTDPDMVETPYIVQVDRESNDPSEVLETFGYSSFLTTGHSSRSGHMQIIYPSKTLTETQREYIKNDISCFEKALFSFDYDDPRRGYTHHIDVNSFIDYFLINEFTLNYDAVSLSTYLYRDPRGKIKLCVWDFNSAFDYYEFSNISPETFKLHSSMWYKQLFKDENFVANTVERYWALRKTHFNEDYLFDYIDSTVAYLGPAIERNYEKYGYSFREEHDFLKPTERNVRSYEEAIAQLKDSISKRITHMDEHIERLHSLSHDSLNKRYNYAEGAN